MASTVLSDITEEDRVSIEDAIEDATAAAERFLKTQKDLHKKLLEVTVDDALSALSLYKEALKNDPKKETYKIHMLVPVQVLELLKEEDEAE